MIAAPLSLVYNTERFCCAIRQNMSATFDEGLVCYQRLIRQNLREVLVCTFPLFAHELTKHRQSELIEGFLHVHSAEEVEFHHIATEWLTFMQMQPDISAGLLALMEYEWLLFSVEISPFKISAPQDFIGKENSDLNNVTIRLNPTLTVITLPFILGGMNGYVTSDDERAYAVYRKHDHQVCYKQLSLVEQHLFHHLKESPLCEVGALKATFSAFIALETLDDWLLQSIATELIVLF